MKELYETVYMLSTISLNFVLVIVSVVTIKKLTKPMTRNERNDALLSWLWLYTVACVMSNNTDHKLINRDYTELVERVWKIEEIAHQNLGNIEEMRGEDMDEAHKVPAQRKTVALDWKCSVCECDVSDDDNYCASCGVKFQTED